MRLLTAVIAAIGFLSASNAFSQQALSHPKNIDHVVQEEGQAFIQAGTSDGLSVATVINGKPEYFNFGRISRDKTQPPTQDTVYEIGSISKTFTSLLLAHSILEKKVAPSDDVRRYLPGTFGNLAFDGTPISLKDLAATTSALPNNPPAVAQLFNSGDPEKRPFAMTEAMERYSDEAFLADLHTASLDSRPGTTPRHSNVAAQLLGYVVERIYGRPYDELLASYIEKPLGMGSGVSETRLKSMATGYDAKGNAMPLVTRWERSAGGLRYSAADMARYLSGQLAEADPAIKLTHQPLWGDRDGSAIGFNWIISKTVDGKLRLRHSGGTFGFSSYVEFYPELHYGIVLLSNRSERNTQAELQALAEHVLERTWGKPPALTALETALARRGYQDLDGTVKLVRQSHPELHLSEDYVNAWGYQLLGAGRAKDAVGIFEYNTIQFPQSANAFDSLGEAYRAVGDVARSIANYRRSLELNPANENARDQVREMEKLSSDHAK